MEKNHYTCISAIDIDSVLKIEKRAYPQKNILINFIDFEIIDDDTDENYFITSR